MTEQPTIAEMDQRESEIRRGAYDLTMVGLPLLAVGLLLWF